METQDQATDASKEPREGTEDRAGRTDHAERDKLSGVVEPLKHTMREMAEQQKDAGAEQISSIAAAVHGAAHELEGKLPAAADYIHGAAARIEEASSTMRNRSVDDLISACDSFARREPAVFFSGAMIAGFALSRFLKSSAAPSPRRTPY